MHTEKPKFLWWGYQHQNGNYQAKRFFDERDLEDAEESPFAEKIIRPFKAFGREDALKIIKLKIKNGDYYE